MEKNQAFTSERLISLLPNIPLVVGLTPSGSISVDSLWEIERSLLSVFKQV
jgi:hypothetical protein